MGHKPFKEALKAFELSIGENPGDFFPPDKFEIDKPESFAKGDEPPKSLLVSAKHEIGGGSLGVTITHDGSISISVHGSLLDRGLDVPFALSFRESSDVDSPDPMVKRISHTLERLREARRRIVAELPDVFPGPICAETEERPGSNWVDMECFSRESIEEGGRTVPVVAAIRYSTESGVIEVIRGGNNFVAYKVPPFLVRAAYDVLRSHRNQQRRDKLTHEGGGVPPLDSDIQIGEADLAGVKELYKLHSGSFSPHDYRTDIGCTPADEIDVNQHALWLCQHGQLDGFMKLEQQWHGQRRVISPAFPLIATPEDIWKTISAEVNRIVGEAIMKVV